MSELARAAAAFEAEDHATALAILVEAWRTLRAPELAELIEELSELVVASPLAARRGPALRDELEARAGRDVPADFELLAATPLPRSIDAVVDWLRVLAAREPDPRFASFLHRLLDAPPSGQNRFWKAAFELVAAAGDPRSIARLETFDTRLAEVARPSSIDFAERRRAAALESLRTRFARVPALAPGDHDVVAKLRARLRDHHTIERAATQDADALLAEIRTNPGDDRTRLVYADVLQQRGDPRGELIALQLAGDSSAASTRRQRSLIATHGARWLGAIAQIATMPKTRFARGFPVAVTLNARTEAQLEAVAGAPEWATIEEVTFTGAQTSRLACAVIVCHPVARGLRAVRGLGTRSARAIATASPALALTTLGVSAFEPGVAEAIHECPGLPALQRIELERPAWVGGAVDLVELRDAPIAKRLRAIALTTGTTTFELAGDTPGDLTRLRLVFEGPEAVDHNADDLREIAGPPGSVTEIVIVAPPTSARAIEARVAQVIPRSLPRRVEHP